MNDLEERLRADLQEATGPIRLDPDLDAITHDGDRVIRSRRVRGAIAGVTVLAVVAVGWAGLGYRLGQGGAAVLATPAPASATAVDATPGTSDVVSGSAEDLPSGSDVASFTVTARLTAPDTYELSFLADDTKGDEFSEKVSTMGPAATGIKWQTVGNTLIGFVPRRFDWIQYVDRDAGGAWSQAASSGSRTFGRLDATVVWRVAEDGGGHYSGLLGYLWSGADGVIRDNRGEVVTSAPVVLPTSGAKATFYLDEALDVLGCAQGANTASWSTKVNEVQIAFTAAGTADGYATGGLVMPRGASDVTLTSSGSELESVQTRIGGRLAILASARMARAGDQVVNSVAYTDASGARVTKRL